MSKTQLSPGARRWLDRQADPGVIEMRARWPCVVGKHRRAARALSLSTLGRASGGRAHRPSLEDPVPFPPGHVVREARVQARAMALPGCLEDLRVHGGDCRWVLSRGEPQGIDPWSPCQGLGSGGQGRKPWVGVEMQAVCVSKTTVMLHRGWRSGHCITL